MLPGMKRILVTGMSGVGKSSVLDELRRRGYKAVDADSDGISGFDENGRWEWNESRVQQVLATADAEVLFFSGTSIKMRRYLPQFDYVVLLSAPAEVMAERLRTRTNNPYGQKPGEIEESLEYKKSVEPILRTMATIEIDTCPPLEVVVAAVLAHVECSSFAEGRAERA
jgi:dephospho-CoA kinase